MDKNKGSAQSSAQNAGSLDGIVEETAIQTEINELVSKLESGKNIIDSNNKTKEMYCFKIAILDNKAPEQERYAIVDFSPFTSPENVMMASYARICRIAGTMEAFTTEKSAKAQTARIKSRMLQIAELVDEVPEVYTEITKERKDNYYGIIRMKIGMHQREVLLSRIDKMKFRYNDRTRGAVLIRAD